MVKVVDMIKDETSAGHTRQFQVLGRQVGYTVNGSLKKQRLGSNQFNPGLQCATQCLSQQLVIYPVFSFVLFLLICAHGTVN